MAEAAPRKAAARRHDVEGRQVLGQRHRVMQREHQHRGDEPGVGRDPGRGRVQQCDGGRDLTGCVEVAGDEVLLVAEADLLIIATAVAHGLTIVTSDVAMAEHARTLGFSDQVELIAVA